MKKIFLLFSLFWCLVLSAQTYEVNIISNHFEFKKIEETKALILEPKKDVLFKFYANGTRVKFFFKSYSKPLSENRSYIISEISINGVIQTMESIKTFMCDNTGNSSGGASGGVSIAEVDGRIATQLAPINTEQTAQGALITSKANQADLTSEVTRSTTKDNAQDASIVAKANQVDLAAEIARATAAEDNREPLLPTGANKYLKRDATNTNWDLVDVPEVIDEDDLVSNSVIQPPSQRSVHRYVDRRDEYLSGLGNTRRGMQLRFIAGTGRTVSMDAGTFLDWNPVNHQSDRDPIGAQPILNFGYYLSDGTRPTLTGIVDSSNTNIIVNGQREDEATGNIVTTTNARELAHRVFVNPLTQDVQILLAQHEWNTSSEVVQKIGQEVVVIPPQLASYELIGAIIVPQNSNDYLSSNNSGILMASDSGSQFVSGGALSVQSESYLLVNNDVERDALTNELIKGVIIGVVNSAENNNGYAEYRIITPASTFANSVKQKIFPEEVDNNFINVTTNGQLLEIGKKYFVNTFNVVFQDPTEDGQSIRIRTFTPTLSNVSIQLNGKFNFAIAGFNGDSFTLPGGKDFEFISKNGRWQFITEELTFRAIGQSRDGQTLPQNIILELNSLTVGRFNKLPETAGGVIRFLVGGSSSENIRIEQFDTSTTPQIVLEDFSTAKSFEIEPSRSGQIVYAFGDGSNNVWKIYRPWILEQQNNNSIPWQPNTAYVIGDVRSQNRLSDGALYFYAAKSVRPNNITTWDATEESEWIEIGAVPENLEILQSIAVTVTGYSSSFTIANSLVFVDADGNDYSSNDFEFIGDTSGAIPNGTLLQGIAFNPPVNGSRTITVRFKGLLTKRGLSAVKLNLRTSAASTALTKVEAKYFSGNTQVYTRSGGNIGSPQQYTLTNTFDFLTDPSQQTVDAATPWNTDTEYTGNNNQQFRLTTPSTGTYTTADGTNLDPNRTYNLYYVLDRTAAESVPVLANNSATVTEISLMNFIGLADVSNGNSFRHETNVGIGALDLSGIGDQEIIERIIPLNETKTFWFTSSPAFLTVFDDFTNGKVTRVDQANRVELTLQGGTVLKFTKDGNAGKISVFNSESTPGNTSPLEDEIGALKNTQNGVTTLLLENGKTWEDLKNENLYESVRFEVLATEGASIYGFSQRARLNDIVNGYVIRIKDGVGNATFVVEYFINDITSGSVNTSAPNWDNVQVRVIGIKKPNLLTLASTANYQKIGNINLLDYGNGFVKQWGVTNSVNNVILPIAMKNINDCDMQVTVDNSGSIRFVHLGGGHTSTQINFLRSGDTGASFRWYVFGEKQ